jgi:hypothetical protein
MILCESYGGELISDWNAHVVERFD